jgi:DNA polymerase-3 subunit delta
VTDNAHFDIFALVESALSGKNARSLHILKHLQAEGIEPALILWALSNELRLMDTFAKEMLHGVSFTTLFTNHRIGQKRQGAIQLFLRREKQLDCWKLLSQAAEIDRIIKGAKSGQLWDSLQTLALAIGV